MGPSVSASSVRLRSKCSPGKYTDERQGGGGGGGTEQPEAFAGFCGAESRLLCVEWS